MGVTLIAHSNTKTSLSRTKKNTANQPMSIKTKSNITRCLTAIENDTFDEDTVRTLLIVSREHVKGDGLIKELAHFVAHSDRDKGMFHRKVNCRYTKMKLMDEQSSKPDFPEIAKTFKSASDYSDYLLGAVNLEKIDSKLFKILYEDGLEDLPDDHIKVRTNMTKAEVSTFFKEFYVEKDGFFYLKTGKTEFMINLIKKSGLVPTSEIEESMRIARESVEKINSQLDHIQKVIRGDILYAAVFDAATFKKEIKTTISNVINKFQIDRKYLKAVDQKSDEIMLCVMTLLHDSTFRFYDNKKSRNFLGIYLHPNPEAENVPGYDRSRSLYENGMLCLFSSGKQSVTFPVVVSDLPVKKYLSHEEYLNNNIISSMTELLQFTAVRKGKDLQLTNDVN
jgi:hypothetical protein